MAAYVYQTLSGLIVPDTSELKQQVEKEWQDVFGADLSVDPSTPQGVMIAAEVMARAEVLANNAALANQINPYYAGGVFLDDIYALTGIQRRQATYTKVTDVQLHGIPSTNIPAGSQRKTKAGDRFFILSNIILDEDGKGFADFQAVEAGPIPCPAHALTEPVEGMTVPGWETSDNPNPGTIGEDRQSDLKARRERMDTLATQARGTPEAIYSRVRALPGVSSLNFRENFTSEEISIDGISIKKNSIWVCVDGGEPQAIADSLYRSKSIGCGYSGSEVVQYKEPLFGQGIEIRYSRPKDVPVTCRVSYSITGSFSGNPDYEIKQAIMDYASGHRDSAEPGFVIGAPISPWELAAACNARIPTLFFDRVEIARSSNNPDFQAQTLYLKINERATITVDAILTRDVTNEDHNNDDNEW